MWLVAGLAAAGVLGAAAGLLFDKEKIAIAKTPPKLSKDQTVAILKDLHRECTPAFITLCSYAGSIREQTGGKIKDAYLKQILMTQSPLQDQLEKSEKKVFEKHGVTEQIFRKACNKSYSDDEQIQGMMKQIKDELEGAFVGKLPEMKSEIPEIITKEITLKILETMYLACRRVAYRKMEALRQKGIQISPHDPQVIQATQEMEVEVEAAKNKVYAKFGIDNLEVSASLLIHKAVHKYSETDPEFVMKTASIERNYKMKMAMMMEGGLNQKEREELERDSDDEDLIELMN